MGLLLILLLSLCLSVFGHLTPSVLCPSPAGAPAGRAWWSQVEKVSATASPFQPRNMKFPGSACRGGGVVRSSSTHTARPEPQHEGACFVCLGCTQPPAAAPKGVAT